MPAVGSENNARFPGALLPCSVKELCSSCCFLRVLKDRTILKNQAVPQEQVFFRVVFSEKQSTRRKLDSISKPTSKTGPSLG